MDSVATEDLVLATLVPASDSVGLSTVAETIAGGGDSLSQQVEAAVAVETLLEQDFVCQESRDESERLTLTEAGRSRAETIREDLAGRQIELDDGSQRRKLRIAEVADELDRSVVTIASACSDTGVYYTQEPVDRDELINREPQRTEFDTVLDRVERTGQGETVRIVGTDGNGKTTLARAVFEATADTVDICETRSRAAETEAYQPIRDLLAAVGVDDLVGGTDFESGDTESYRTQQTGLFTEITERLTPASGIRVLFFDDVNYADAATWQYLSFLRERLSEHPLVVVVAHRPGTLPADAPVHPATGFADTCLEVTGLSRDEVRLLIEQVIGHRGVPAAFADAVHERTGGTPLFVETTVQTLLETGQLDSQLQWYPTDPEEFDLPDAVTEMIQHQAVALEESVRDVLEWVAVASGPIPISLVAAAADASPDRVRTVLETVAEMGLLSRIERDGEHYVAFGNEMFGDALLEQLDDEQRAASHERLAELYEQRAADTERSATDSASTVAFHYAESGDTDTAIEWYERAADRATDVYAHETAIGHYYRVIDLARQADDTETVLDANEHLAEIYTITGEYDRARRHVQFVRERTDGDRGQTLAWLRARIHSARGEFDETIEVVTDAIDPDAPSANQGQLLGVLADAYDEQGDFEQATAIAERQHELATTLGDESLEADALRNIGVIATKRGNYDRAETSLTDALDLFRGLDDRQAEADCLQGLGDASYRSGAYDQCREYLEQARDLKAEIGDRQGLARSLWGIGRADIMQGAYDRAEEANERALDIFQDIGDRQGEGDTLNNLGVIAFRRREYDRTREYLEAALAARRETGNRDGVANILNNLGNAATLQGAYDSAREYFEQSLPIHREIDHPYGEAMCLRNIGNIVQFWGEYERAREYYEEALEITHQADSQRIRAMCLNDLGNVARLCGEYEQAREHYEESLAVKREIGERHGEAETLLALGRLAVETDDFDSAREYVDDSRDVAADLGDPRQEALALCARCGLARRRGDTDEAREYLDQALALVDEETRYPEIGKLWLEAGRLALARGEISPARDTADQARELFVELDEPLWLGRTRRLLGSIEHRDGNTTAAREHWQAAVATFEEIGVPAETLRTLTALTGLCREQGDDDQALAYQQRIEDVLSDAPAPLGAHHG